ncbi:MAG: hypothetical protein AAGG38_13570 [Planctomycetota bacterium]
MSKPVLPVPRGVTKDQGSAAEPAGSTAPAAWNSTRARTAAMHLLLLAAAGLVVWTMIGSEPQQSASASVTGKAAAGLGGATTAGLGTAAATRPGAETLPDKAGAEAIDWPITRASPIPRATTRVTEDTAPAALPVATAAAVEEAAEAEEAPQSAPSAAPMLAIPEAGGVWPRELPAAAESRHAAFGRVYGLPGATRVVYLIDASGSLIDTMPFVLAELQRALTGLRPEQSYAVIFFAGDRVLEAPPLGMTRATGGAVTQTVQWIDPASGRVIASGPPTVDAAMRRALAYAPDAVVLLSDGLIPAGDRADARRARLTTLIDTANTTGVVFHTAQLRRPDPMAGPTRRGTLEMIAALSGGTHRYISEADMIGEE